jgi:hypothetical protein
MWLALVGGIGMLGGGVYEYLGAVELRDHGQRVKGKVHESQIMNTGKGRKAHHLTLDYTPAEGATVYRKQFVVPEAVYNQAVQAGEATVTFLPNDPTVSAVGDAVPINYESFAMGIGLLATSAAIAIYRRRQWKQVEAYIRGAA